MTDQSQPRDLSHRLQIDSVDLVGGGRQVSFTPGMNVIRGDISTGKTTLIRLLHALLGSVPGSLPPETSAVRAVRGVVWFGSTSWSIYRPMVSSREAPVELAILSDESADQDLAFRLPANGPDGYGDFVLGQLGLPIVSVPRARREPTNELTPITINDWLLYCIVTGDDLDTQVFGHRHPFRDLKRRWVFEIAYGLYDEEFANLTADLRRVDLAIRAAETEAEVVRQFLAGTTVGSAEELAAELAASEGRLKDLAATAAALVHDSDGEPASEIAEARERVLQTRQSLDSVRLEQRQLNGQIADLLELERQLVSLSKRLTRSIVADEWLVDFDFVVCPRCGHGVDRHRAEPPICYLCEQPEPNTAPDRDSLIREQDRVTAQLSETADLLEDRRGLLRTLQSEERDWEARLNSTSRTLDALTGEFVSAQAANLQALAAERATLEANLSWIRGYLSLSGKQDEQSQQLAGLLERKSELEELVVAHESSITGADENIAALEGRMLDYLTQLHAPQLGDLLTVRINRSTYLPEVSGRTFDELSSQGLKTLVNVAHALAQHTVAIDRGLPLPGLLVLDGVSANAGREGLERDRVLDMYELFERVTQQYVDQLQLVIVDNDVPQEIVQALSDRVALTLSQEDRLIAAVGDDLGVAQTADVGIEGDG